jgi:hypothetical protein
MLEVSRALSHEVLENMAHEWLHDENEFKHFQKKLNVDEASGGDLEEFANLQEKLKLSTTLFTDAMKANRLDELHFENAFEYKYLR